MLKKTLDAISTVILSSLNLSLSSSATTSRNSRLVVDEDDLMRVKK